MGDGLDYGILYCNQRGVFYAELMFRDSQWGEILLDSHSGEPVVTIWNCNFTVLSDEFVAFISKATSRLREFEDYKEEE